MLIVRTTGYFASINNRPKLPRDEKVRYLIFEEKNVRLRLTLSRQKSIDLTMLQNLTSITCRKLVN